MSPVEQDTIDCEYLAYFLPKKNFKRRFRKKIIKEILGNFLARRLQCFWKKINIFFAHKNMKKTFSKVAHNRPNFFSVLPTGSNSAQISYSAPYKWLPARLLYNDFGCAYNCAYYNSANFKVVFEQFSIRLSHQLDLIT